MAVNMTAARSAATILLFLCALFRREANALFGPKFPPTIGQVWPAPNFSLNYGQYYFTVDYNNLDFEATENNCDLLEKAFRRYTQIIKVQHGPARFSRSGFSRPYPTRQIEHSNMYRGSITKLLIELKAPCEERPHLDMDEKYELLINIDNEQPSALLRSDSVWGILRGMETFSQVLYRPMVDSTELWVNATYIRDFPRYKHRGLLLDTSRHYLSLHVILTILDGMAYNKFNVLHWHIVDDQSFPYQSTLFPNLSEKGAYHPVAMIYTKKNIQMVIEHARLRGIRVLAEFDVPGHTRSWGEAYPDLLTPCYNDGKVVGLGPMDPTKETTYQFLEQFLNEVISLFPDASFHFGGDEVDESCWQSNPQLQEFMKEHDMNSTHELHAMFMRKVLELKMDRSIIPIVWQEVFDNGVPMPTNSLVQIWKDNTPYAITQVTSAGYDVLFSSCWYLDHLKLGGDWDMFYKCDPALLLSDPKLRDFIIGGEACMWGESVDNSNVLTRIFPRSCAAAERLWSDESLRDLNKAANRLEEHACRMSQRGIPTQPPNGPGYCL